MKKKERRQFFEEIKSNNVNLKKIWKTSLFDQNIESVSLNQMFLVLKIEHKMKIQTAISGANEEYGVTVDSCACSTHGVGREDLSSCFASQTRAFEG